MALVHGSILGHCWLSVDERGVMYPGSPPNESAFVRLQYYALDARVCGRVWSYTPGKHSVKVMTTVVGVEAQPLPITLEMELSCANAACAPTGDAGAAAAPDAGTVAASPETANEPRASEASPATLSAARDDVAPESALDAVPQTNTPDGCTLGALPGTPSSGTALVTLSVLLATALRRRRSRPL